MNSARQDREEQAHVGRRLPIQHRTHDTERLRHVIDRGRQPDRDPAVSLALGLYKLEDVLTWGIERVSHQAGSPSALSVKRAFLGWLSRQSAVAPQERNPRKSTVGHTSHTIPSRKRHEA